MMSVEDLDRLVAWPCNCRPAEEGTLPYECDKHFVGRLLGDAQAEISSVKGDAYRARAELYKSGLMRSP